MAEVMEKPKATETMLKTESQNEAAEIMEFLGELDQSEKKDFLKFMQGVRFARGMTDQKTPA